MIKNIIAIIMAALFAAPAVFAQDEAPKRRAYDNIIGGDAEKSKENPQYSYLYDTSLIRAIKNKDIDRVTMLLYANVDTNEKNDEGFTPLVIAAESAPIDIVEMMLKRNAKVNLPSKYNVTPLMSAAAAGRKDVVTLLLEYGADPNMTDDNGLTPLLHAAKSANASVIQVIAAVNKTKIDARDKNKLDAVLIAAGNKDVASLKVLTKAGANINTKDNYGKTPLILAVVTGDVIYVRDVLDLGANKEERDNIGRTALMHAVQGGFSPIIAVLLQNGANLETRDLIASTPLILAAKEKNNKIVKELLKSGADINAQDTFGRSALVWSVENGDAPTMNTLLANPAVDVNLTYGEEEITPLMSAAAHKDYRSTVALTKSGARINTKDLGGNTPLFYAVKANDTKTAAFLIKNGADAYVVNNNNETMLETARANDNTKLSELIASAKPVKEETMSSSDDSFWDRIDDIDAYIASLEKQLDEARKIKAERAKK